MRWDGEEVDQMRWGGGRSDGIDTWGQPTGHHHTSSLAVEVTFSSDF